MAFLLSQLYANDLISSLDGGTFDDGYDDGDAMRCGTFREYLG